MNKFDERYNIRLADLEDITMIMKFIDEHWRKNHIMAVDRNLFEYEFVFKNQVNFVLAIDKEKNTIEGLFGFLNASHPENKENKDIWGSFWKVKEGNMPFLGIEIAKRVEKLTECRMELGVGLNAKTAVPLRKKVFKDRVRKMNHYYRLNNQVSSYEVASIQNIPMQKEYIGQEINVKQITSIYQLEDLDNELFVDNVPYKDKWYLEKRFLNHPYYKYQIYVLEKTNNIKKAILVIREIECKGRKILRIVDYIGNQSIIREMKCFFDKLITDYEYIDLYTYGFKESYLLDAGFALKNENDLNIIPNYFEPYHLSNVDLWVNYPSKYENEISFFRGDADQDRPNFLRR